VSHNSTAYRLATVSAEGVHWTLRRNCSVTPGQLGQVFVLLGLVSLAIAGFFWFQGAVLVLPFAVLELTALATAFLVHARHATDLERISVLGSEVLVEIETAGRTERCALPRAWARVDAGAPSQLVEVRSSGASVLVGRHLRSDLRPQLAREIRQALHGS
jgi:uncharacterized membrane protein